MTETEATKGGAALAAKLREQTEISDPALGAVPPSEIERASILWPEDRWEEVERQFTMSASHRTLEEYHYRAKNGHVQYVGIMFETMPDGSSKARMYTDHHLVKFRSPILPVVEGLHAGLGPEDILVSYFGALARADRPAVLDCFEEDGFFRHSNGETFRGREELDRDFTHIFANGPVKLKYCTVMDNGNVCCVEVVLPNGRPAIAVYLRGPKKKLQGIRIYL